MSPALKPVETLDTWLLGSSERLTRGDPPWLARERGRARERLRKESVPGPRQEEWRYTNLRALLEQRFRPAAEAMGALEESELQAHLIPDLDAWRVVLVNCVYVPGLSRLEGLPAGVKVASLRQLLLEEPRLVQERLNGVAGPGAHVFAPLNTAGLHDGFVLQLAKNTHPEKPLELIHLSLDVGEPHLIQPRHLVRLEAGARITLIERYLSTEPSLYCTNNLMEIDLGEGSHLEHRRLQEESPKAFHLSGLYVRHSARSRYRGSNVALGAAWSRTDIRVAFEKPGGDCEIDGLYLAGDGQLVDFHLDVEHRAPGCASREHFKGLLTGKGRAVLDGRIYVAKHAQQTDAHLKNANLLLSRHAEVDTKPQLEIHADDVKCSHGASVGQIEPEQLFYLRSRGISTEAAQRMLCQGFAGEIIDRIEPEPMRNYAYEKLDAVLDGAISRE
jgi:Fe-S cluster assembly protein SufD